MVHSQKFSSQSLLPVAGCTEPLVKRKGIKFDNYFSPATENVTVLTYISLGFSISSLQHYWLRSRLRKKKKKRKLNNKKLSKIE